MIVPSEGGYHQWLGAIASAGASLSWMAKLFGDEEISSSLAGVESIPPGAGGLIFLPHLAGERGPIHDPNARGALVGLLLNHDRPKILRAILEGVAFQIAAVIKASNLHNDIEVLTVVGGGANSRLWVQIIADILDKKIEVPVIVEAGLLGTAALTGSAIGLLSNPYIKAAGMFRRAYLREPDSKTTVLYSDIFRKFEEIDALLNNAHFSNCQEENIT
jgi:xylulokinase